MTTPDKKRNTWGNYPTIAEVLSELDTSQLPVQDNGELFSKIQVARKPEGIVAIPPHEPTQEEINSWQRFGSVEQVTMFRLADQWLEPYFSHLSNSSELKGDYFLLFGHPFQQG